MRRFTAPNVRTAILFVHTKMANFCVCIAIPASDWPTAKVYPGYISILTNHNSKPCMQFTQLHEILACDWPRGSYPLGLASYNPPIKQIKRMRRFCPKTIMTICKFRQSSQIDAAKLLQMSRYTFEQLLATPPNTPTVVGPFTPGALDGIAAVPAAEEWDVTDFEPSHDLVVSEADQKWVAALSDDCPFETPSKTDDDVIFVAEVPAAPIKPAAPTRTYAEVTAITISP